MSDALTDHFLRAASIGAVSSDCGGIIAAINVITVDRVRDLTIFCCAGGKQHKIAIRARSYMPIDASLIAAIAAIRQAAADLSVSLTPHDTVVKRARATVAKVEQTIADMQKSGALKAMNSEFKAAREAGLATSYSAFVHAKKLALLEAMASGRR